MTTEKNFQGKHALYLEDQLDKVKAITDFLEGYLGLEVTKVETPEAAFDVMSTQKFDIIILDIRLLNGSETQDGKYIEWQRFGLYFIQELRSGNIKGPTPAGVPVLVITCVVSTPDVEKLCQIGVSAGGRYRYISKPVLRLSFVEDAVNQLFAE